MSSTEEMFCSNYWENETLAVIAVVYFLGFCGEYRPLYAITYKYLSKYYLDS